jgi:NitT/TauT family transport system substrate-binding protein
MEGQSTFSNKFPKTVKIIISFGIIVGIASVILFTLTMGFTENRGPITIGVEQGPLSSLMMTAEDQGFFSKHGVDVTVKYYASGKLALNGMFSGEVDLATPAETPFVFSSFERRDFSIVATIGSSDNEAKIVARKDMGIQKPGDLRGKRIATQKASAVHFFLHSFLTKYGLSDKDIKLSFKHPDELVPALANGEIDAFSMREPYVSKAKTLLKDNIIVFEEPGLYLKTYNLVALNTFIKDRPQAVKSILRALIKSEEFVKKHPEHAQRIVSNKTGVQESEVAGLWSDLRFEVSLEQSHLTSLENEARWAIRNKLADGKKIPNYLNFIYLDALEAVKPKGVTIIR